MRSSGIPKLLECHGFVCQTPEDAIVIAATLYQSLMAHVSTNSTRNKRRTPRNQNGVSCISIASSVALTASQQNKNHYLRTNSNSSITGRKNSINNLPVDISTTPIRPARKKRSSSSNTSNNSAESDSVCEITEMTTTTEENKKKSHKTRRAPPIPLPKANKSLTNSNDMIESSISYLDKQSRAKNSSCLSKDNANGDILTRVAIPRSGSFLNTSGLTRYKSRVSRRNCGKIGGGGGG